MDDAPSARTRVLEQVIQVAPVASADTGQLVREAIGPDFMRARGVKIVRVPGRGVMRVTVPKNYRGSLRRRDR